MQTATIGLDIAKRGFQAHGAGATDKAILRRKLQRAEVLAFFTSLPPCLGGIEACGTAHHWAREIGTLTLLASAAPTGKMPAAISKSM